MTRIFQNNPSASWLHQCKFVVCNQQIGFNVVVVVVFVSHHKLNNKARLYLSLTIVIKSPSNHGLAQFDRLFVFFGYSSALHYNHWPPQCNWNTGERMLWSHYHVFFCLVTTWFLVSPPHSFLSRYHAYSAVEVNSQEDRRGILTRKLNLKRFAMTFTHLTDY